MVVVHGTRIISARVLQAMACPVVNMHAGITPRYRGVHGGYWALAEGHPEWVGTTVHLVDPGVDTGGILAQATFEVSDEDTIATYPDLHLVHGLALLGAQIDKVMSGPELETVFRASLPDRVSTTTQRSGATSGTVGAMGCDERAFRSSGTGSTTISVAGVTVTSTTPGRGRGSVARGTTGNDWEAVNMPDRPGALVISLDFELHWGVRDHVAPRRMLCTARLPEARRAVEDMLTVFGARHIRATWATVGFLFASNRREVERPRPRDLRPTYARAELNPYVEPIGDDEEHDPEHLAGSLVELIAASAGQEVGSHTFSHYYCLEPGQNEATFRADLAAAQSIARGRGIELTSLVLPRNQWNPAYAEAVLDLGFRCIRGPQRHGVMQRARSAARAFCAAVPGWPIPMSASRLLPRRGGTTSCCRRACATSRLAPS